MEKLYLTGVINKYYLKGFTERVKIVVKDKTANIKFITLQKNLVGNIVASNIDIEDCEVGIYDTTQLLKLLNITDKFLTIQVDKHKNISKKLLIADNNYNLEYSLADTLLIPMVPVIEEPNFDMEANIDNEFINKFIKAKKALDTDVFVVESSIDNELNNTINFILGGTENYTNKINFSIPASKAYNGNGTQSKFPIEEFKEILDSNEDLKTGKLFISEQGLMKIYFVGEKGEEITYFLVGKE
jgi:hypothetical protein